MDELEQLGTTCTLCPRGEIVPENHESSFRVLNLNSNGDRMSCSDAISLVKDLESDSVFCSGAQLSAVALCQKTPASCVLTAPKQTQHQARRGSTCALSPIGGVQQSEFISIQIGSL